IGKFMYFLPVTLIVALLASLLVAYIINPVFAADFMKPHAPNRSRSKITRGFKTTAIVFGAIALIAYASGSFGMGNLAVFLYGLYCLHHFYLKGVIERFQTSFWPRVQASYKRVISWCLEGWRPAGIFAGVFALFIFSIVFTMIRQPPVVFFPNGDPNFIYTFIRMPIGTDQVVTDSVTRIVEDRVIQTLGDDNPLVESVISNVAIGASENPFDQGLQASPHLGKVTVAFVKFAERDGQSTRVYLDKIREAVQGIKGAEISVSQEQNGPPTDKPINIEISAEDFNILTTTADRVKR